MAPGLHWMGALVIALGVHALGLVWFNPLQRNIPLQNPFRDEIVVMLGEGSGNLSESARLLKDPDIANDLENAGVTIPELLPSSLRESVKNNDLENTVLPRLVEGSADLEAVEYREAPETDAAEQETESSDIEAPEIGKTIPSIMTNDTEATETIVAVTPVTETGQTHIPAPAAVPDTTDDADQPTPAMAESVAQEAPLAKAAPPVPLAGDTGDMEVSDVIEAEEGSYNEAAEITTEESPVEDADTKAPEHVITPVLNPALAQAREESALAPQPGVFETEQPSAIKVEQGIRQDTVAAVVLEFETVGATTVPQSRITDPTTAPPISIEEQIARVLNPEELQAGSETGIVARYAGQLKGRLEESMHYPRAARLAGQEGKVVVRFVIDRNGRVLSIVLEKASGHAILDRETVEMIERGEPFPVIPAEMSGDGLELRVPVVYKIREESRNKEIPPINLE